LPDIPGTRTAHLSVRTSPAPLSANLPTFVNAQAKLALSDFNAQAKLALQDFNAQARLAR
jgi:hypothetical protein